MPRPKKKQIFLFIAIALIIAALIYFFSSHGKISTDDAAIDSNIVAIAPKIPGYVKTLNIADNQQVKKGDVILEIDPTDYEVALQAATAQLSAAQAQFDTGSGVTSAQAQVNAAEANYQNAQSNLKRYQSLPKGALSRLQLDAAQAQAKVASSQVTGAQAKSKELEAAVKQAEAQVAIAAENLKNTRITAPFDGRITNRGVELGAYVQPGEQLVTIVSNDYWVVANFKETQLEHMRPGQPVSIKIDAYPAKIYSGKIDSIQHGTGARFSAFPPENATGNFVKIVQRVPVKILFTQRPDASLPIGPGMSVVPSVDIK